MTWKYMSGKNVIWKFEFPKSEKNQRYTRFFILSHVNIILFLFIIIISFDFSGRVAVDTLFSIYVS